MELTANPRPNESKRLDDVYCPQCGAYAVSERVERPPGISLDEYIERRKPGSQIGAVPVKTLVHCVNCGYELHYFVFYAG